MLRRHLCSKSKITTWRSAMNWHLWTSSLIYRLIPTLMMYWTLRMLSAPAWASKSCEPKWKARLTLSIWLSLTMKETKVCHSLRHSSFIHLMVSSSNIRYLYETGGKLICSQIRNFNCLRTCVLIEKNWFNKICWRCLCRPKQYHFFRDAVHIFVI